MSNFQYRKGGINITLTDTGKNFSWLIPNSAQLYLRKRFKVNLCCRQEPV